MNRVRLCFCWSGMVCLVTPGPRVLPVGSTWTLHPTAPLVVMRTGVLILHTPEMVVTTMGNGGKPDKSTLGQSCGAEVLLKPKYDACDVSCAPGFQNAPIDSSSDPERWEVSSPLLSGNYNHIRSTSLRYTARYAGRSGPNIWHSLD